MADGFVPDGGASGGLAALAGTSKAVGGFTDLLKILKQLIPLGELASFQKQLNQLSIDAGLSAKQIDALGDSNKRLGETIKNYSRREILELQNTINSYTTSLTLNLAAQEKYIEQLSKAFPHSANKANRSLLQL